MGHRGHMRHGSLQFWPRKRAAKVLPSASFKTLSRNDIGLLGFIGYKVGMASAYVRDNRNNSLTKGQRITIPVTIIEFPTVKIFSTRFYKNGRVMGEILNSNIDKEVKKKVKVPKEVKKKIDDVSVNDYDDLRVILYSQVKKTGIKKKPDMIEVALSGSKEEKINFVKENVSKEISVKEFMNDEFLKTGLIDIRGVTVGRGLQGPTKRFGLKLRSHKSEKGVRGPGSGGPWHPARVEYTQPMAGQMGYFTRVITNGKVIDIASIDEKNINPSKGFKNYGVIKNDYVAIFGSVTGPSKRPLFFTMPARSSKNQTKKNFEFIELR
jgi:large subunit ribosomal protein L3